MTFFQSPQPTQYDLRFSILGIPVRVHPLFWLITLLLGSSGNILYTPLWILAVFVSILIHEIGHALAFRRYGQDSYIVLHFGGGVTVPDSVAWGGGWANVAPSPMQQIVISLSGPMAGFILATLVILGVDVAGGSVGFSWLFGFIPLPVSPYLPFGGSVVNTFLSMMLWVNVFWGLVNLLPVFPLDGGHVARNILIQIDPLDGVRKAYWISAFTGILMAIVGLIVFGSIYMALLFGLLAFQSFQAMQVRY